MVASLDRARRGFRVRGAHLRVDARPHGVGIRGGRHPDRGGRVGSRCDRLLGRQLGARIAAAQCAIASGRRQAGRGRPAGIVLGTVLDGIPESVVIGISLLTGEGVGLAFLAAVAISNLPESISGTIGLRSSGWATRKVMGLWADRGRRERGSGGSGVRAPRVGAARGRGRHPGLLRRCGPHDAGRHDDARGIRRRRPGRGPRDRPWLRDRGAADARLDPAWIELRRSGDPRRLNGDDHPVARRRCLHAARRGADRHGRAGRPGGRGRQIRGRQVLRVQPVDDHDPRRRHDHVEERGCPPSTTTSPSSSFRSGTLSPGESYKHTFGKAGTFGYRCSIHVNTAKVVVTGPATPQPTRRPTPKPTRAPTPRPTPSPSPSPSPSASASPTASATASATQTSTPTTSSAIALSSTSTASTPAGQATPAADANSPSIVLILVVALAVAGAVGLGALVVRRR